MPGETSKTLFTIVVPAIAARFSTSLPKVLGELFKQAEDKPVEVLCLLDNKRTTLSEKRNAAIGIAHGRFLSFVDDDDMISEDYID